MTSVDKSAELLHAMSLPDLIAFVACPLEFQDHFEQVMMEKYGIAGEA